MYFIMQNSRSLKEAFDLCLEGYIDIGRKIAEIGHTYIVGGCSIVRSSESGIALHTIPFYGD